MSNSVMHVVFQSVELVFAIFFLDPTSKPPELPESTAPPTIDRSSVTTATLQRSIAYSQIQSTTKNYKPDTMKGSTTIITKSKSFNNSKKLKK